MTPLPKSTCFAYSRNGVLWKHAARCCFKLSTTGTALKVWVENHERAHCTAHVRKTWLARSPCRVVRSTTKASEGGAFSGDGEGPGGTPPGRPGSRAPAGGGGGADPPHNHHNHHHDDHPNRHNGHKALAKHLISMLVACLTSLAFERAYPWLGAAVQLAKLYCSVLLSYIAALLRGVVPGGRKGSGTGQGGGEGGDRCEGGQDGRAAASATPVSATGSATASTKPAVATANTKQDVRGVGVEARPSTSASPAMFPFVNARIRSSQPPVQPDSNPAVQSAVQPVAGAKPTSAAAAGEAQSPSVVPGWQQALLLLLFRGGDQAGSQAAPEQQQQHAPTATQLPAASPTSATAQSAPHRGLSWQQQGSQQGVQVPGAGEQPPTTPHWALQAPGGCAAPRAHPPHSTATAAPGLPLAHAGDMVRVALDVAVFVCSWVLTGSRLAPVLG